MATSADASHRPDQPEVIVRAKGLLTVAIMAAMVMQVLDATIANVALPHMQTSLGATQESVTWVLTSYILASAVAIPATGWLADRIGVRNLLLMSVLFFGLASVLCGIAPSLETMVVFRALQGVAGAFIGPLAQTVMLDINKPSDHAKAMSVYGMGVMIAPIAGPVLGGYLTEQLDWRWVFLVNVPIGIVCFSALWLLLPRLPVKRRRFDLAGWVLIAVALASLQLLLDRGQTVDWFDAVESWVYLGVLVAAAWAFCIHLATTGHPLFPGPMLRDRNFMAGVFFMAIVGATTIAVMALLPAMLQGIYGYSVIETGQLLASRGLGVLATMAITGRITGRVDARLLVGAGLSLVAFSLWLMSGWTLEMDSRPFLMSGLLQGMGLGLVFVPLNVISLATLSPQYRTDAAGLLNLSRNLGSSLGISLVTVLLARNTQINHAELSQRLTPFSSPLDFSQLNAYGQLGEAGLTIVDGLVARQAVMLAYLNDFWVMMIFVLATVPLLVVLRKPKPRAAGEPLPVIAE